MSVTVAQRDVASWSRAYRFALLNAGLFFGLSAFSFFLGVTSIAVNCAIAGLFFVGSLASAAALFRAGQGLVAVGFFVAGAGLLFGFGTAYTPFAPTDDVLSVLFNPDEQRRMLATINAVNATSVLLVLLAAGLLARPPVGSGPNAANLPRALQSLSRYVVPILALSWAAVALQIATFPQPHDMLLRGATNVLSRAPLVALVLVFSQWRRQSALVGLLAVLLALAMIGLGLASTSKPAVLLPAVAVIAALALDPRARPLAAALGAAVAVAYFLWLAPLATEARHNILRSGAPESLGGNIEALLAGSSQEGVTDDGGLGPLAARFSSAPYQSYLINRHDAGVRGHSLDDAWTALIPRAVWAGKPNITRFGMDLYIEINRRFGRSQLAPSYTGEAYWNYGWLGVVGVSLLLGLQIGWLTQQWLALTSGDTTRVGILAMSIPVALSYFWVETWISASYVGGFITLVVLIKAIDMAVIWTLHPNRRSARPSQAPAGQR
jgi:hypothetical protein